MASYHLLFSPAVLKPYSFAVAAAASSSSTLLVKPSTLSLHRRVHKCVPALFSSPSLSPSPRLHRFFCNSSLVTQEDHTNPTLDSHPEKELTSQNAPSHVGGAISNVELPNLTIKEKKELASYAHGLGKKLKIQLVGKSGVTDSLAAAFVENLESNELLKVKIHNSCPGELPDVIQQLEVTTGSVAVGQIGRSVILYRPSISKLKAEEKKRQNQRLIAAKRSRRKYTEFQVKPAEFRYKPNELRR